MHFITPAVIRVIARIPVKGGEVEGRKMAPSIPLMRDPRNPMSRSSRTCREQMRARKLEDEKGVSSIQTVQEL